MRNICLIVSGRISETLHATLYKYFQLIKSRVRKTLNTMHLIIVVLDFIDWQLLVYRMLPIKMLEYKITEPLAEIYLTCNGEIYNYKHLIEKYDLKCTTDSDCEVILQLYILLGRDKFMNMISELDGEFALVLYDHTNEWMIASRDRIGVRSMYYAKSLINLKLYLQVKLRQFPLRNRQNPTISAWASLMLQIVPLSITPKSL